MPKGCKHLYWVLTESLIVMDAHVPSALCLFVFPVWDILQERGRSVWEHWWGGLQMDCVLEREGSHVGAWLRRGACSVKRIKLQGCSSAAASLCLCQWQERAGCSRWMPSEMKNLSVGKGDGEGSWSLCLGWMCMERKGRRSWALFSLQEENYNTARHE